MLSGLFADCETVVKWVYGHKLVKQKFNELQKQFCIVESMLVNLVVDIMKASGALLRSIVLLDGGLQWS